MLSDYLKPTNLSQKMNSSTKLTSMSTAMKTNSSVVDEMKFLMKQRKLNYQKSILNQANNLFPEENSHLIQLTLVLMAILIIVGVIGNLINILVFSRRNMRKVSTFRFLLYLAITDMFVLLVCSTDALSKFGMQWEIRSQSTVLCRLHTFLTYVLTHASSTILMVVSVDRALVVSNSSFSSIFGSIKDHGRARTKMYTAATNRRRSTLGNRASRVRLTVFGRRFYQVDVITALIFVILTLLNSHYLALIDLTTITENSSPARTTLDWTLLTAMAALSSSFQGRSKTAPSELGSNSKKSNHSTTSSSSSTAALSASSTTKTLSSPTTLSALPSFDHSQLVQQLFFSSSLSSLEPNISSATAVSRFSFLPPNQTQADEYIACFPPSGTAYHTFLINYWFYIDMSVYWFIPFIVMSFCSVIILSKIRNKNKRYFRKLLNSLNNRLNRSIIYRRSKKSRQILYMLLMTNIYFLVSQLPYCISFILLRGTKSESTLGQLIVHVISYTNNSFNFLFYGFSSQYYRKQLLKIFKRTASPT